MTAFLLLVITLFAPNRARLFWEVYEKGKKKVDEDKESPYDR